MLTAMRWSTSRGKLASHRQNEIASLLSRCAESWQRQVVLVFDPRFAGTLWLGELDSNQLRFILRRLTRHRLVDSKGDHPDWQITQDKRFQDHRQI